MATALTTRLKLRYDIFENWKTVNPVLLAGEAAVAVASAGDNTGLAEPCVTIKIGDGTSAYNDLPFISALAGDVLTACKTEDGLVKFIEKVLVDAGVLSGDETGDGASLAERVTDAEGAIKDLQTADEEIRAEIAAKIASVYKASGSVASADDLPAPGATTLGNVYNVVADFTTTDDFIEGAGKNVPAGSNVVIVETKVGGNGFDGTLASAYNVADSNGNYRFYIGGQTLNGHSFMADILKINTVEYFVDTLNNSTSSLVMSFKPYTYDVATGKISDKNGNLVTFVNESDSNDVITFKEPTPAEYAYDVVGSFINMADYLTKADTEKLVSDTKDEIVAMIPDEVKKALEPTEVPVDPDNPDAGTTTEKSPLLEKVEEIVDDKVNALDYADTAEAGKVVVAVSQTDALISVVKKVLETGDISNFETEVQTVIKESLTKPVDPVDPDNPTEEETAAKELYDQIMKEVTELVNNALKGADGSDGEDGKDGLTETIEKIVQDAIKNAGGEDDGQGGTTDPSGLNTAVKEVIAGELDKLDYEDDGENGVVTVVEQNNGLISVTKTAIRDVDGFDDAVSDAIDTVLTPPEDGTEPSETYTKLVESITNTVTKEIEKVPAEGETNDLAEAIKKAVEDALKEAGTPADPDTGAEEVPGSSLNTTVNEMIDSKIDELDYTDEAEELEVTKLVNQENGVVAPTKVALSKVAFTGKFADLIVDEDPDDPDYSEIILGGGGA